MITHMYTKKVFRAVHSEFPGKVTNWWSLVAADDPLVATCSSPSLPLPLPPD